MHCKCCSKSSCRSRKECESLSVACQKLWKLSSWFVCTSFQMSSYFFFRSSSHFQSRLCSDPPLQGVWNPWIPWRLEACIWLGALGMYKSWPFTRTHPWDLLVTLVVKPLLMETERCWFSRVMDSQGTDELRIPMFVNAMWYPIWDALGVRRLDDAWKVVERNDSTPCKGVV